MLGRPETHHIFTPCFMETEVFEDARSEEDEEERRMPVQARNPASSG